jgi:hypothetical protein
MSTMRKSGRLTEACEPRRPVTGTSQFGPLFQPSVHPALNGVGHVTPVSPLTSPYNSSHSPRALHAFRTLENPRADVSTPSSSGNFSALGATHVIETLPCRRITKQTLWPLVRKRNIPTERPLLVDEI